MIVTENGISCRDWVSIDGQVKDQNRIDFLSRYLCALMKAAAEGVDVRGYFLWSMLDNFEWAEGFKERFGIVHVDFETQRRTIKESGHWFSEVVLTNGNSLFSK